MAAETHPNSPTSPETPPDRRPDAALSLHLLPLRCPLFTSSTLSITRALNIATGGIAGVAPRPSSAFVALHMYKLICPPALHFTVPSGGYAVPLRALSASGRAVRCDGPEGGHEAFWLGTLYAAGPPRTPSGLASPRDRAAVCSETGVRGL